MTEEAVNEQFANDLDLALAKPYIVEKFEEHDIALILPSGEGEGIEAKVTCRAGHSEQSCCTPTWCAVKDQIDMCGIWDVLRSKEDQELVILKAKIDWSDPEEPWVEVEVQ